MLLDIDRTNDATAVSAEVQQTVQSLVEGLSVPIVSAPQPDAADQEAEAACKNGQKSMLASLSKWANRIIPSGIFSWQNIVLGGQVMCYGVGTVLTLFNGGSVLLLLAGFGLAIAIADIACLIYYQKHGLPKGS